MRGRADRASCESVDTPRTTVDVVNSSTNESALINALETRQANLVEKIAEGEASVRLKEAELTEKLTASETRVGLAIAHAATIERTAVRAALASVLERLREEEERRAELSSERVQALAEREWRGALLETLMTAETEITRCCTLLETRAGQLVKTFDEQLAALVPDAMRTEAKVASLAKAASTVERTTIALAAELERRINEQLAQNEQLMRTLVAAVGDATSMAQTSAAEDRAVMQDTKARMEVAHTQRLDALRTDALGTYIGYVRELKASDSALADANRAVEAAHAAGLPIAAIGATEADEAAAAAAAAAAAGEERVEVWQERGLALGRMAGRSDELRARCEQLTRRWTEERARQQEAEDISDARASAVDESMAELTALVSRLTGEVDTHRERRAALEAEIERGVHDASAREAEKAELISRVAALECELQRRDTTEAALNAQFATVCESAHAAMAEVTSAHAAVKAAQRETATAHEATGRAEQLTADVRHEAAIALVSERARSEERLAAERAQTSRVAREGAAARVAATAVARACTVAVGAERDAARLAHASAEESLLATRQAMAAAAELSERCLDAETERRVAAEAAHALEAAACADAEGRVCHAAMRLRAVTRYPPRAAADEIDAALATVLHACALPRQLTVERIERGWYWIGAAAGDGLPASRPRRIHLILAPQGNLMVRATANAPQGVQGVRTVHPVDFFLAYLDALARAEDTAALAHADEHHDEIHGEIHRERWALLGDDDDEPPPPKLTTRPSECIVDGGDSAVSAAKFEPTPAMPRPASRHGSSTTSSSAHYLPWRASRSSTAVDRGTPVYTFSIDDLRTRALGPRIPVAAVDLFDEVDDATGAGGSGRPSPFSPSDEVD